MTETLDGLPEAAFNKILKRVSPKTKPEILYHYTSAEGLRGIVQEKRLYASDIRFLNDSAEREKALEMAEAVVATQIEDVDSDFDRELYRALQGCFEGIRETPVYVTSFSERADDLSQWRGYCPATGGYAIGFLPAAVSPKRRGEQFLGPCVYEEGAQADLVGEVLTIVEEQANERNKKHPDRASGTLTKACNTFAQLMSLIAPVLKDSTFENEAEWRVVSSASFFANSKENYRLGSSLLIPYHTYGIRQDLGTSILTVTVGPTPHPPLANEAVSRLLKTYDSRETSVKSSAIPYRAW